ncbi:MAG: DAK2 domain-containing protein [Clostridia bacterium]|nr:DAK2 domain-containing protein [Clostridia bacterium]
MSKSINGATFTNMVITAAQLLDINKSKIDASNVFPVPDGDTGTNMTMTMQSVVGELRQCKSNRMNDICDRITRGALRGARGNSGVITSQILKGMCLVLRDETEINMRVFAKAMKNASDVAYAAVSKPKEGTILTVIKCMSDCAQSVRNKSVEAGFAEIIEAGEAALEMTPQLLPVLKKAGVVDSGGMGLVTIFKGMNMALNGQRVEGASIMEFAPNKDSGEVTQSADMLNLGAIEFAYCTEFFIINIKRRTTLADIDKLREHLMEMGDSVICIGDLELVKVHVHTNTPGKALTHALQLGELDKVKIENMLEQNRALVKKYEAERKPVGIVSVAQGEGICEIFKELNVDRVIEGGQTMNPSASDIAECISRVNAETVFVFPNNKNIILAAEQSKALVENRKIIVVPTKNIPQGFAAALAYDPEVDADKNLLNMLHAIDNVTDGQVTYSVRSTKVDGFSLKKGDYIGLNSKKILSKGNNLQAATVKLIERLKDKNHSIINIYYGADVKQQEAEQLQMDVQAMYEDCDVELYYGGQSVYYYILSLE